MRRVAAWGCSFGWAANVLLLVVLCGWIVANPRVGPQMDHQWREFVPRWERAHGRPPQAIAEANRRTTGLQAIRLGAVVTMAIIVVGLFFGAPRHRRMRSWLALTALVAAWLTVFTSYPSLAWAGQRWRVSRQLDEFEAIAAPLRSAWPFEDSSTEALGPFNAYPIGQPQVLLLLTTPPAAPQELSFAAIERSPEGALRFDLVGSDGFAWLEWQPKDSQPASFVGGLGGAHTLIRATPLGRGWYLVAYRVGAPKFSTEAIPFGDPGGA
jgi:hypothetical protein